MLGFEIIKKNVNGKQTKYIPIQNMHVSS